MTNKDILKYVINTPQNTNPSVLSSLLEEQDRQKGLGPDIDLSEYVKSVNNIKPDKNGNVEVKVSSQNVNKPLNFTGAMSATYDGSEEVTINIPVGGSGGGLSSTEKNAILTILDGVIVETSKQSIIAQALATLKQLWSGGEVYVSQSGTTLALENVTAVTTITQNGTTLALA